MSTGIFIALVIVEVIAWIVIPELLAGLVSAGWHLGKSLVDSNLEIRKVRTKLKISRMELEHKQIMKAMKEVDS